MKKLYTLILLAFLSLSIKVNAQIVNIPDSNFYKELLANGVPDSAGYITVSIAKAYTGGLSMAFHDLTDLTGIQAFTSLKSLACGLNSLTSLDLSSNTALVSLDCDQNFLTSLDMSSNTALTSLNCESNFLTSLDVSSNKNLTSLYCDGNYITGLNVSACTHLNYLDCSYNRLTSLNVQNGNNIHMPNSGFDATYNPSLTCIQVDNVAYSDANWFNIDPQERFSTNCTPSCIVSIPDPIFKAALVNNPAINTNGDGEIQCSEAAACIGTIDLDSLGISDLTGIEAFTSITGLDCAYNLLDSLDVSSNTYLNYLDCDNNLLTSLNISSNAALTYLNYSSNSLPSLDVSSNTALANLDCSYNGITSLDISSNTALASLNCSVNNLSSLNVSSNKALTFLDCSFNAIANLDVSSNKALTYLDCGDTWLTSVNVSSNTALNYLGCRSLALDSLNVSFNTALIGLFCGDNLFGSLNVSSNTALTTLDCWEDSLTSLDISLNTALITLDCSQNYLKSLDISSNPGISLLDCYNNSLTSLNVQNGNNTNFAGWDGIDFTGFNASNNPLLLCIEVDNEAWADANWAADKDSIASFSNYCHYLDINETAITDISIYPNPVASEFIIESQYQKAENIKLYNVLGEILKSLNPTGNSVTIDMSTEPAGIYFLQITDADKNINKKIVKQ